MNKAQLRASNGCMRSQGAIVALRRSRDRDRHPVLSEKPLIPFEAPSKPLRDSFETPSKHHAYLTPPPRGPQARRSTQPTCRQASRQTSYRHSSRAPLAFLCLSFLITAAPAATNPPTATASADETRGQEIIRKFVEANRYWLFGPPAGVQNFSYVLQRLGGTQEFTITDPAKTPRARLQGVT